jgi:hypothetical protein
MCKWASFIYPALHVETAPSAFVQVALRHLLHAIPKLSASAASLALPLRAPRGRITTARFSPRAAMVQFKESVRQGRHGHDLYTVEYHPDSPAATRAALCFHHGVGEHVGRYNQSEPPSVRRHHTALAGVDGRRGSSDTSNPPRASRLLLPAVFTELADAGVAVYAADAAGHGKSAGARTYIDKFSDVVRAALAAMLTHPAPGAAAALALPGPRPPPPPPPPPR